MELLYISKKNRANLFRDRLKQKTHLSQDYKNIYIPPYNIGHQLLKHPSAKVALQKNTHKAREKSLGSYMSYTKRKNYKELPENGPRAHIEPKLFDKINKLIYLKKKKKELSPRRFKPKYNDIEQDADRLRLKKKRRSKTGERKIRRRLHGEKKRGKTQDMRVTSYTRRRWTYQKKEKSYSTDNDSSFSFIQVNLGGTDVSLNVKKKRDAFMKKMRNSSNHFYKKKKEFSRENTREELEKEFHRLHTTREQENSYLRNIKAMNYNLHSHLVKNNKFMKVKDSFSKSFERRNETGVSISRIRVPRLEIGVENIDLSSFRNEESSKKMFTENGFEGEEKKNVLKIFDEEESFLDLKKERLDQMSLGLEEIRYEIRRVDRVRN